jgi:hypothetical protein
MLITKSLKRPYFVTAYNGDFVQCVSPMNHNPDNFGFTLMAIERRLRQQ